MFGYIRPLECELRVREQQEYRGVYCGLCKSIGRRFGQLERLTLSYDCAFLALSLFAIAGGETFSRGNCGPRIYRGKRPIADASPVLDYAADVNVLLAWHKAADDERDEKSDGTLSGGARFNALWANVQTLLPAIYAKAPQPVAEHDQRTESQSKARQNQLVW